MKGRHHIVVETRRLKYEFDIKRNITIIQGDSASGKTTLVSLLREYSMRGESSGVSFVSDVRCEVYYGAADSWKRYFESIHNSIIFIDEGYGFIFSKDFADAVSGSDNYFVLITRKPLRRLPYSVNEIYGIRTTGRFHFPEKIYHEFYPLFEPDGYPAEKKNPIVLVEDEKSGYQFFSKALDAECIGVGGNAKFYQSIREHARPDGVLVIADGAAFGAYITDILSLRSAMKNISLYLPESFEWIILRAGVTNAGEVDKILAEPENYIDSSQYLSWERFFMDFLVSATKDDSLRRYRKNKLSGYYLKGKVMSDIIDVLPSDIKALAVDSKI